MKLDDYIAVSGMPNVYKLVTNKANGLILSDLDTGKTKFYPVRKHQFTPMASVAIYTLEDTIPVVDVFSKMKEKESELPVPKASDDKMALLEYFEHIVPDYDEDRVYVSDIKKVIKWYTYLNDRKIFELVASAKAENASSEEE